MLRVLLIFVVGALVGANVVYWAMTRRDPCAACEAPAVRTDAPAATLRTTPPARTSGRVSPAKPSVASTGPASTGMASTGTTAAPDAASALATADEVVRPSLSMPLRGLTAAQLRDTFHEARGGERTHEALDILAPAGTPVLAVADGHVEKLFESVRGGLTIYQFDPGKRYAYYYAHLQGYAPGLAEGQALRRGQVIGYVGSTGNADAKAPHLHFAVFELGPERQWWKGTPLNPYPLLGGTQAAR